MRSQASTRVLGPYQDGSRWRVLHFVEGRRTAHTFPSRDLAMQKLHELRQPGPVPRRSLAGALREYDAHLQFVRRLSPASSAKAQRSLHSFLGGSIEEPIASLTAAKARKLARFAHPQAGRIRRRFAVSTRYAVLGHAFRFFDWAKSRHYIEVNPFDGVRPAGLIRPGPAPLSLDQARTLAAVTLERAPKEPGALGALLVLILGLRSSQVLALRLADVDLEHKRLRIAVGATFRWLPIPDLLLPCFRAAPNSRPSEALLLGPGRTGKARPQNFLWRAVQRLCKQAGVTAVNPRGLRKLHVNLSRTATRTSGRVSLPPLAARLVLRAVDAEALKAVRVIDLLGLSLTTTGPRLDALLSLLTADQLAEVWPLLEHPAQAMPAV